METWLLEAELQILEARLDLLLEQFPELICEGFRAEILAFKAIKSQLVTLIETAANF